jgi:hypothetical protein
MPPDGRPYYGGFGNNELNPDFGAGIYVIDNTAQGYSFNLTAQLRRTFGDIGSAGLGYSFTKAKNALKSTEIASVLWQNQPVQGDPNRPELSWSEFGQRHRILGDATYTHRWSDRFRTHVGLFVEIAERFGLINPWYTNVDLRIQQDVALAAFGRRHGFQIGLDVMNVGNPLNSDWGVRKIADPAATSPLTFLNRFDAAGRPVFNFTGPERTFIDDPDLLSRWRAQIGVKYFFE